MQYRCHRERWQLERAESVIRSGGVLLYPTETLYALGADACNAQAAARIVALKRRQPDKPLPLIIGGLEQLIQVTSWDTARLQGLAEAFWPGPLSLLVPARQGLAAAVQDAQGWTSVRWTPHPAAAELCLRSGRPLIATSANLSGQRAVCRSQDLDPVLTAQADLRLDIGPPPGGGPPSSLVRLGKGKNELILLREGAITAARLRSAGYTAVGSGSLEGEKALGLKS
jgi:L-threonylcarbamoyladenylate synthase